MLKTLSFYILLISAFYSSCKGQTNKLSEKEWANMMALQMKAMDASMSGDKKSALKYFDLVISRYPGSSEGYYGRAEVKESIKDYVNAIKDIDTALNLLPGDTKSGLDQGDLICMRGDCERFQKKENEALDDYKKALERYNKVLKMDPSNEQILLKRSTIEERLKDYPAAINDMESAIKNNPAEVFYYYRLSDLKKNIRDYNGVISASNKALRLKPNSDIALFDLGYAYYQLKEYSKAIDYFGKCLTIDPKFYETLRYRGLAKLSLKDKNGACSDWHEAAAHGFKEVDSLIKVNCH